jgi:hypothetical protein
MSFRTFDLELQNLGASYLVGPRIGNEDTMRSRFWRDSNLSFERAAVDKWIGSPRRRGPCREVRLLHPRAAKGAGRPRVGHVSGHREKLKDLRGPQNLVVSPQGDEHESAGANQPGVLALVASCR